MNVLVTGATGFLGRHVVAALLARGERVRALVRPAASPAAMAWAGEVEVVRADLRSGEQLREALAGRDVVVHLAASVAGDDDAQFAATVVGTERLLAAMEDTPVTRLVLAGSITVYDWERADGELSERTPTVQGVGRLDERGGYTVAKAWQEQLVRGAARRQGFELVVLRPGFIWAAGHEPLAGLGQTVGPLQLVIGPRRPLPITYVENCAEAFALATVVPAASGQTMNVVDPETVSAWRFAREYGRRGRGRNVPVPVPYRVAAAAPQVARRVSRAAFGEAGRLPSILAPRRFEARFKPLGFPSAHVQHVLGWRPPLDFAAALDRAYGPPA